MERAILIIKTLVKRKKIVPPVGDSVWHLARHQVACSMNPEVGEIFSPFLSHCLFHLIVSKILNGKSSLYV